MQSDLDGLYYAVCELMSEKRDDYERVHEKFQLDMESALECGR